ncbi:hypothetical protein WJX73_003452 [Symbiochloris irregularis]|uniref:BZIP domain-containing protein n=1 Tax=Symbiochloris irregularis TaxID=706552 RepID=A0AAW1NY13_9CHLO
MADSPRPRASSAAPPVASSASQAHAVNARGLSSLSDSQLLSLEAWQGDAELVGRRTGGLQEAADDLALLRGVLDVGYDTKDTSSEPLDTERQPSTTDEAADDGTRRRSQRQRSQTSYATDGGADSDEQEVRRHKGRVGRPILYRGDPEAPHLSDGERRKIKRRIANRESARRVREKKQETSEHLQTEMDELRTYVTAMEDHVEETDQKHAQSLSHLQDVEARLCVAEANTSRLQAENAGLRAMLVPQPLTVGCEAPRLNIPMSGEPLEPLGMGRAAAQAAFK